MSVAFNQILERISRARGVVYAALDSQPPLVGGGGSNGLIPEGQPLTIESVIQSRSHYVSAD